MIKAEYSPKDSSTEHQIKCLLEEAGISFREFLHRSVNQTLKDGLRDRTSSARFRQRRRKFKNVT